MTGDGGPAFARSGATYKVGQSPNIWEQTDMPACGMSLRDYFAGQALVGILANGDAESCPDAAKGSYAIADAMLAARAEVPT